MSLDQHGAVKIIGLMLAAGSSERYGSNKLRDAYINGQSMGLVAAAKFRSLMPTFVVVRPSDLDTRKLFEAQNYRVIDAEFAEQGMGYSLAAGMRFATEYDASACLVGLADMPFIGLQTLQQMIDALTAGATIARPRYAGKPGQPVGFQREVFSELRTLDEDKGARDFLTANVDLIHYVDVDDVGITMDIDTPAALERALKLFHPA